MRTLPGWQRALALVRASEAQTINLDELLFFEIDRNSENSPLLVLRAQMGATLEASFVALDEPTLALLGRPEGEPLVLGPCGEDAPFAPLLDLFARCGFACGLVAPVRHGERLSGCLVGCSAGPRSFTPSDVAVFKLLASYLAVTVENDRLRAETDFRFSEAMSLEAVSSALVEERSLDAILSLIIDEAMRVLNACDALVLLLDAERDDQWFQVRARKGQGVEGLTRGRLSVIDSLNGMVIRTGKPLVSQDARTDPRANQARARRLNVGTVVIAPLNIRHKTIGTIAVHNKREGTCPPGLAVRAGSPRSRCSFRKRRPTAFWPGRARWSAWDLACRPCSTTTRRSGAPGQGQDAGGRAPGRHQRLRRAGGAGQGHDGLQRLL